MSNNSEKAVTQVVLDDYQENVAEQSEKELNTQTAIWI